MTKQRWTSEKQRRWLEEFIPKFLEAQANDETSVFFPEVHRQWALAFPHAEPSAANIEKANGNQEKAAAILVKKTEKRISQWFHNTTRPSGSKQPIIKMKQTTTKLCADWQAYQSLYYETKLKAMVDQEYEKHKQSLKDGEKPKPRIKIQTDVVRAEYNKESKEVKAEVEAYRLKLKEDAESNDASEIKPENIANAVDRLPSTLAVMLKTLQRETGWAFTVLAGGPSPRHEGKIATYIMHQGHTAERPTEQFEQFLGKASWNETVLTRWDQFLHGVYPPEVRTAMSLSPSSKQGTPDAVGDDTEATEDEITSEDVSNEVDKKKKGDVVRPAAGLSTYEVQKAKNIARNGQLLAELKERYKSPEELDPVAKDKPETGGKKGGEKGGKTRSASDEHL